jgi:hypothetical protein
MALNLCRPAIARNAKVRTPKVPASANFTPKWTQHLEIHYTYDAIEVGRYNDDYK